MKRAILVLAILAVVLVAGCVEKPNITDNKGSCKIDGDCVATCGYGCVNKDYMNGKVDCLAVPEYTCECVNSQCQKA